MPLLDQLEDLSQRGGQVVLMVKIITTRGLQRLHSGMYYEGFGLAFAKPDRALIDRFIGALSVGGLVCDAGLDDGRRPWDQRILDGTAFEVRDITAVGANQDGFQLVHADNIDPDWFTTPRDAPGDRPQVPHQNLGDWVQKDLDIPSGRTVFRKKMDGRDYDFQVREADSSVIKTLHGSENGVKYMEPHVYFDKSSEGNRVVLLDPGYDDQTIDLPPSAPHMPVDFTQAGIENAIVPDRFFGDAQAALARAVANQTTYVLDEGWRPFRVRNAWNGGLELVEPDRQYGPTPDDQTTDLHLHATTMSGVVPSFYICISPHLPKAERYAEFEKWMHALRPGRGIRDASGALFDGARFELQELKLFDHNPWRHSEVNGAQYDPTKLTIA